MDEDTLTTLIDNVRSGVTAPEEAASALRRLPFSDLGFARIDHHRTLRQGLPEAVYAPGKTPAECVAIVTELLSGAGPVVVTRTDADQQQALVAAHPEPEVDGATMVWRPAPPKTRHTVAVVTAGTSDRSVADECAHVLGAYGQTTDRIADVGVAGIHRLLVEVDRLVAADIVIVVAGMEGALASVVGGLCAAPVIAVPTSVGYGAGLEGVTALLGMLASCAPGITVVGIDNGYGAAVAAMRILGVEAA